MPKREAGTETGPGANGSGIADGESTPLLEEGEEEVSVSAPGVSGVNRAASAAGATVDELLYETAGVPCQRYSTDDD